MNPFRLNEIIRKYQRTGQIISTNDLSRICDCKISHAFLILSDELFICNSGRPHHRVIGLRASAWIKLWFYNPPKFSEYSGDYSVTVPIAKIKKRSYK